MREGGDPTGPAGSALAVDRDGVSAGVSSALTAHPTIPIGREKIAALPAEGRTIVATGPLTAPGLAASIGAAPGADSLAFFDAIAPIVYRDRIDFDFAWFQSRWNKGEDRKRVV